MDSGFNNINIDFERMDWLKCYWVKLNRYKKILSKSFYGVWLSLARALALGARGPEFKSLYPDLEKINIGSHSNLFWI